MRTIVAAVALLLAVSGVAPVLAQPVSAPTDCTEAMIGANTFIGHDCGEWVSVVIAGNIIIRKPWSRANPASQAVRIRNARGGGQVDSPTSTGKNSCGTGKKGGGDRPPEGSRDEECNPAYSGCLSMLDDLNCEDIDFRHLRVFDPANDLYGLDGNTRIENGITCDDDCIERVTLIGGSG